MFGSVYSYCLLLLFNKLNKFFDVLLFKIKEWDIKGDGNFLISFIFIFKDYDFLRGNLIDCDYFWGYIRKYLVKEKIFFVKWMFIFFL